MLAVFLLAAFQVHADYGQIPKPGFLHVKTGFDYFASSENFASDGAREDIQFQGQTVDFTSNGFWIEPEYGVGEDLAAQLRLGGWSGNVNPTKGASTLASGSGISDINLSLKWSLFSEPQSTIEFCAKLPAYGKAQATTDLASGDGSVDLGIVYHLSLGSPSFRFFLSPAVIARTGGLPPQLRMAVAGEARVATVYFRAFSNVRLSLGYSQLGDSSEDRHDAIGSGGSFARLSGGPSGVDVGIKSGVEVYHRIFTEAFVSQSVAGVRYPNALTLGLNLHVVMDTNPKDTRVKIYEVPIDKPAEPVEPSGP